MFCDIQSYLFFRLLDDLGNEIEMTDSKLQTMLIRVEKVLRLADGRFCLYGPVTC